PCSEGAPGPSGDGACCGSGFEGGSDGIRGLSGSGGASCGAVLGAPASCDCAHAFTLSERLNAAAATKDNTKERCIMGPVSSQGPRGGAWPLQTIFLRLRRCDLLWRARGIQRALWRGRYLLVRLGV